MQVLTDLPGDTADLSSGGGFGYYVDEDSINVSGRMRLVDDGFAFT